MAHPAVNPAGSSEDPEDLIAARLRAWRRGLIDLTYRNRLIKYAPARASTLVIDQPSIEVLLGDTGRGRAWDFYFPPALDEEAEADTSEAATLVDEAVLRTAHAGQRPASDKIVLTETNPLRINRSLENLARRSNSEFQDKALRILYIAAGFLDWVDPARGESLSSPLVLVPVRLERQSASHPYRLFFVDDEETVINPSLVEKLRHDARLDLPADFVWEDKPVLTELNEIAAAVSSQGWTVRHTAVLSLFSFQKYVMYRDLLDNEPVVTSHPLVRSLALKQLEPDATPSVVVPEPADLDDAQSAAETYSILDADASQRAAIEAAKRGQSFVLHGPPGTGKSQTISNIIAEAIALGKKILFVSEKAAALEVVHNRLRARGLADYCLLLHGEHAGRREVVEALHSSLTTELVANRGLARDETERYDHLRAYLNRQVDTLHYSEPILGNRSIRDVNALLSSLYRAPAIPGAPAGGKRVGDDLRMLYQQLDDIFGRLAAPWHVSSEDYIWREFDQARFSSDDRARMLAEVGQLQHRSRATRHDAEDLAGRLGWPTPESQHDIDALLRIADLVQAAPTLQTLWMQPVMPAQLRGTVTEARRAYQQQEIGNEALAAAYVVRDLQDLRPDIASMLATAMDVLGEATGETPSWAAGLIGTLPRLHTTLDSLPSRIEDVRTYARDLARLLGQPEVDLSLGRCGTLAELGRLAFSAEPRPEPEWLVQAGLDRATSTLRAARQLFTSYQMQRTSIFVAWRADALTADVPELVRLHSDVTAAETDLETRWHNAGRDVDGPALLHRFETEYTGVFAKLSGPRRADLKAIRAARLDGETPEALIDELRQLASAQQLRAELQNRVSALRLDQAMPTDLPSELQTVADLQRAGVACDEASERCQLAFGSYFQDRDTDPGRIEAACQVASEALKLRDPGSDMPALSRVLCVGATADVRIAQAADQLDAAAARVADELAILEPFAGRFDELFEHRSLDAIEAAAAQLKPAVDNVGTLVAHLQDGALKPVSTLDDLIARAGQVEDLHAVRAQIERALPEWAGTLGAAFAGADTSWSEVLFAADWIDDFFGAVPTPTPEMLEVILGELSQRPAAEASRSSRQAFEELAEDFAQRFSSPRRAQLLDHARSGSLVVFEALCEALASQVDSLYDWTDFRHFRGQAQAAGWGEFVDQLVSQEISADDIQPAFQKAFWNRRLEALFDDEPELEDDFRGGTHQRFIAEFRDLDQRLVQTGPDRLILRRNAEAPQHFAVGNSEAAVLRHEAGKQRRHLPVRTLLASIPQLLSDLKPCLMMSPLSVSHFLTADHRFDLVIFDEASQVPPQDAINCVYRGSQLIVAGDAKQLPPTSFFNIAEVENLSDEEAAGEEDMESVLDSCQALLPEHWLRWHYRSRHEDLISFSNREIYNDELVTFPTPDHHAEHMGVSFLHVPDGVYERGHTQTNRREAQVVAQRVVDHLLDGSGRSVGVIAFNTAQASAVAEELDLLRLQNPSLEEHFSTDRLDGPFVKHLESVQGDERDIILFSVGYGRDHEGRFLMNFGPLGKAGGHRRLNVAVTRARECVEVISSVRSSDFTLTSNHSRGAQLLRDYISYAEQAGTSANLDELGDQDHFAVSELELEISAEIEAMGFRVAHQVGAGQMRVDLAVIDPERPERFLLGIETDGPGYFRTPTTRDRERLREEVLRGLGWGIHRIWSLDFVRDRGSEIEKLKTAIHDAREATRHDPATAVAAEFSIPEVRDRVERPVIDIKDSNSFDRLPWVIPYHRTQLAHQPERDAFHEPWMRSRQTQFAARLLSDEAPAHIEYLVRRLAEAWGIARVGSRVDNAARQAISQAARAEGFERHGQFYWAASGALTHVRRPVIGDPATKRPIDFIADLEIDLAFTQLTEGTPGANDDELVLFTARLLGFERVSENVRSRLKRRLRAVRKQMEP
jgi:very-short-patch-repair endonuclease